MQLDWTTFALEVLNFLVLVWILKRFLYRPVLAVIDAREARVRAQTDASRKLRSEAEALKAEYESRLAQWNKEREQARRALDEELGRERAARLENLKKALADEIARGRAREQAAATAHESALAREAAHRAYGAAAAMLRRLASAQLTHAIARVFCDDLAVLPDAELADLRNAMAATEGGAAEIASAHPLDAAMRATLVEAISRAAGRRFEAQFKDAPELIAGLRAGVGGCELGANLADELAFLSRTNGHG